MNKNDTKPEQELRFFATAPRPCSYLENREAVSVFADPDASLSTPLYRELARFGFRRSGNDLYVPACPNCTECIPVRIPVNDFRRSRNQQRIWSRNRDLTPRILAPHFEQEHFDLYVRYLSTRHRDGGMDKPTPDEYMGFLTSKWCETRFIELRLNGELAAIAVTDWLEDALSAVYTFFNPELKQRSLGTYAILQQIELARELGYHWHYLGYWIRQCGKMQYKSRFQPLQGYHKGTWNLLETRK